MKVPCKDCEDRKLGCHGDCEKYKEFSQYCVDKSAMIRKAKLDETAYVMAKHDRLKKYRRN